MDDTWHDLMIEGLRLHTIYQCNQTLNRLKHERDSAETDDERKTLDEAADYLSHLQLTYNKRVDAYFKPPD